MFKVLFSLFLLCSFTASFAQAGKYLEDTAYELPEASLLHSSQYHYNQAISYSKNGDSINASECFLKIDQLYFLYLLSRQQTAAAIDTLMGDLLLTTDCKNKTRLAFAEAFSTPRSNVYTDLRKMYLEDQAARTALDHCGDSITCEKLHKRMRVKDSAHFVYLYNYVSQYGWPTKENGGFFAQLIALHDHEHHEYYQPFIQKGVLNDDAGNDLYKLMLSYIRMSKSSDEAILNYPRKIVVDISPALKNTMISKDTIDRILFEVKKYCPIKFINIVITAQEKKITDRCSYVKDNFWRDGLRSEFIHAISDLVGAENKECDKSKEVYYILRSTYLKVPEKLQLYLLY